MIDYLADPAAIYARSFAIIDAEADLGHLPPSARDIARRVIHASAMPEIAAGLRISPGFRDAAAAVVARNGPILTDAEMVRHGIIGAGDNVICTLNDPRARALGMESGRTRSAAAVTLWADRLADSLVIIGNAPTALFALLELLDAGAPRPAAIAAFPVGLVGASEAKAELDANPRGIPYATLLGRLGGSAMAAAVVNALRQGDS